MYVRSARIVRQTDGQIHRQTMPKLLHPSLTRGVTTSALQPARDQVINHKWSMHSVEWSGMNVFDHPTLESKIHSNYNKTIAMLMAWSI